MYVFNPLQGTAAELKANPWARKESMFESVKESLWRFCLRAHLNKLSFKTEELSKVCCTIIVTAGFLLFSEVSQVE